MLLTYKQTIMNAFLEVSNSLIACQKYREFREQQELLAAAAEDTDRLSKILYQHGGASYLQVLTSENNDFSAALNLAQAQLNERLALVQLYNALGGGWEQEGRTYSSLEAKHPLDPHVLDFGSHSGLAAGGHLDRFINALARR